MSTPYTRQLFFCPRTLSFESLVRVSRSSLSFESLVSDSCCVSILIVPCFIAAPMRSRSSLSAASTRSCLGLSFSLASRPPVALDQVDWLRFIPMYSSVLSALRRSRSSRLAFIWSLGRARSQLAVCSPLVASSPPSTIRRSVNHRISYRRMSRFTITIQKYVDCCIYIDARRGWCLRSRVVDSTVL